MEAIAAFSLAAAVINVVDFGLKTVAKCYEIHKEGTTFRNIDFEHSCETLEHATKHLDKTIAEIRIVKTSQAKEIEAHLRNLS